MILTHHAGQKKIEELLDKRKKTTLVKWLLKTKELSVTETDR